MAMEAPARPDSTQTRARSTLSCRADTQTKKCLAAADAYAKDHGWDQRPGGYGVKQEDLHYDANGNPYVMIKFQTPQGESTEAVYLPKKAAPEQAPAPPPNVQPPLETAAVRIVPGITSAPTYTASRPGME